MTLEATDAESEAVRKNAPRVTLEQMEGRIVSQHFLNAGECCYVPTYGYQRALDVLTICIVVLDNGWTLVGKSAPASPENFDEEYGQKLAYEDALRQLWPLEGYLLRQATHMAAVDALGGLQPRPREGFLDAAGVPEASDSDAVDAATSYADKHSDAVDGLARRDSDG